MKSYSYNFTINPGGKPHGEKPPKTDMALVRKRRIVEEHQEKMKAKREDK